MHQDLMERYHQSARQERYEIILLHDNNHDEGRGNRARATCRKCKGMWIGLLKLNVNFPEELAIDIILHSLPFC